MSTQAPATSVLPLGYYCGFLLMRALAARDRSQVYLARDGSGELGALKVHGPMPTASIVELATRIRRLKELGLKPGLLPILDLDTTPDGRLWEWLPLADNLPGLLPLTDALGLEEYSPLTLRSRITEVGPAPARQVARWGLRLTEGLAVLHASGLVHRDVKPGNVLFVRGEPCLADYGLAGESGGEPQFNGTEGYRPIEGTSDAGADIFALGKTLYEGWTGQDRLEFPSLPRGVLDASDWISQGVLLNDVLLRACDAQAARRFGSAAEMTAALEGVILGRPRLNRRRWMLTGAGLVVAGAGISAPLWLRRAPARLVWRRVREKGFNVEDWICNPWAVDWRRGRMFSFNATGTGPVVLAASLVDFAIENFTPARGCPAGGTCLLHPETRDLWLVDGGRGEVVAYDLDNRSVRSLGGGPSQRRHFSSYPYWNPLTRRVGSFGGYGYHAVNNERSEFDPATGRWVVVEPDRAGPGPCLPSWGLLPLTPDPTGKRLFLAGGYGSLAGKQNEPTPDWRAHDGRFHHLEDVWQLDLAANQWTCLLPLDRFEPRRLRVVTWFPVLEGLVLIEGMILTDNPPYQARAWLLRPGVDREPVHLPVEGALSRLSEAWNWTHDPRTGELLLFASDGIYRIAAKLR
jgi:hypothetical protein